VSGSVPLAVTVSGKVEPHVVDHAKERAREWGLPFLPRRPKESLAGLFARAEALLAFDAEGVVLRDAKGAFRFHPGLAHLRVKALERGEVDDRLLRAAEPREGDLILDCTLGLAQDALVMSRAVGPTGRVVGLETSVALHAVVSEGLGRLGPLPRSCRIEALRGDFARYLAGSASASFDVVVFDPMFERPKKAQPAFELLRRFACADPLTSEILQEARRVARRWVVVKGARYSRDLKKLGLVPLQASRSAPVLFARVEGLEA
jgi:hypothetical protein